MQQDDNTPLAIHADEAPMPAVQTRYPEPFAALVAGRSKRKLGDVFGLGTFGVNLVRLVPGGVSTARHHHSREDEFVYLLEGALVLVTDEAETLLTAGMCAGFRAGSGRSHQLLNRGQVDAVFLEVGTRLPGDEVVYPYDDLAVDKRDGQVRFSHKDGRPYA